MNNRKLSVLIRIQIASHMIRCEVGGGGNWTNCIYFYARLFTWIFIGNTNEKNHTNKDKIQKIVERWMKKKICSSW